jgi:hypothetical protein
MYTWKSKESSQDSACSLHILASHAILFLNALRVLVSTVRIESKNKDEVHTSLLTKNQPVVLLSLVAQHASLLHSAEVWKGLDP